MDKHLSHGKGGINITTIKKIAKLANVSSATVSKVINGKDQYISEDTRQKILKIIDIEGYIPNGIAKSLKMKRTKSLGIIVPDIMNQFFSEIARGVEDAAEKRGYSVILCNSDNNESKEGKYLGILQEKMVDGIIMTASKSDMTKAIEKCSTPMVLMDRGLDMDKPIGRITVDNVEGSFKATSYLIEKGCRKIAFISSKEVNNPSRQRLNGYKKGLKQYGIEIDNNKIYLENFNVESGYKGVNYLLERTDVDGICCGNDLIAIGAIRALKQKDIKIPKDIKIIGFDDIFISQYIDPPLTTIKQPIYQLGEEAVKMLIAIIEKKDIQMNKVLSTMLIERGSC